MRTEYRRDLIKCIIANITGVNDFINNIYILDDQELNSHISSYDIEKVLNSPHRGVEIEEEGLLDDNETRTILKETPRKVKWLTVEPGRQYIGRRYSLCLECRFFPSSACNELGQRRVSSKC